MPSTRKKVIPKAKPGRAGNSVKDRLAAFVRAYLLNGENATQAAVAAGYSAKTAGQQGSRLLKNVWVSTEIARQREQHIEKAEQEHGLTTDKLIRSAAEALLLDPHDVYDDEGKIKPLSQWPASVRRCITQLEFDAKGHPVKVKFEPRAPARDQIARMIGAYEKDHKNLTDPLNALIAELMKRNSALPIATSENE